MSLIELKNNKHQSFLIEIENNQRIIGQNENF